MAPENQPQGEHSNDESISIFSDNMHDAMGANSALHRTSAHRKYGLVTMRSSATHFNKRAMETFSDRLSSCFNRFHDHSAHTREALYEEIEEQTSRAIRSMEQEIRDIQEEVEERFKKEKEVTKEDLFDRAFASMDHQYPQAEKSLIERLKALGPDVAARQRAHDQMQSEMKQRENKLTEEHRLNLESGAQARLQEREAQLATQRAQVQAEMEEVQRNTLADLSEKLSREAKDQIAAYRLELENLREARITSARTKEVERTENLLQDLKLKFMAQAEEEVQAASLHEEDEERLALKQIQEEISRFQALKATEITTNARAHRAETLPSMAIELEERAEGIERNFRLGLINEDTKEETDLIESASLELRGHVNGCMEAILSDNEQFTREVSEAFHKVRAGVLKARAQYLKIPLPSGGDVEGSLNNSIGVTGQGLTTTSDQPISVKGLTMKFEQLRQKYLTLGSRLTDAAIEKLLLQKEVKAARLRRADLRKHTPLGESLGPRGIDMNLKCPTCKPLQEANVELQRVASKLRREKIDRGDRVARKSSYLGFGSNLDLSNVEASFASSAQSDYTPALLKSKYGSKEYGGSNDDDDASISSTDSTREADFVRRFLGKVSANSNTLRGTLSKLDLAHYESEKSPGTSALLLSARRAKSNLQGQGPHVPKEQDTPFDRLLGDTLRTSGVNSDKNFRDKVECDKILVKRLLNVAVHQEKPVSFGIIEGVNDSFASRVDGNRSFDNAPGLLAPGLSVESVEGLVKGTPNS